MTAIVLPSVCVCSCNATVRFHLPPKRLPFFPPLPRHPRGRRSRGGIEEGGRELEWDRWSRRRCRGRWRGGGRSLLTLLTFLGEGKGKRQQQQTTTTKPSRSHAPPRFSLNSGVPSSFRPLVRRHLRKGEKEGGCIKYQRSAFTGNVEGGGGYRGLPYRTGSERTPGRSNSDGGAAARENND